MLLIIDCKNQLTQKGGVAGRAQPPLVVEVDEGPAEGTGEKDQLIQLAEMRDAPNGHAGGGQTPVCNEPNIPVVGLALLSGKAPCL